MRAASLGGGSLLLVLDGLPALLRLLLIFGRAPHRREDQHVQEAEVATAPPPPEGFRAARVGAATGVCLKSAGVCEQSAAGVCQLACVNSALACVRSWAIPSGFDRSWSK